MIMKRAVLYARVSGDDRHREDRNLLGQLDICRKYAIQRGYQVVEELAEDDRGASGAAFELPQLNRVRELAQAKAFDVLITRELDRLSRNLAKQLFVEEEMRRSGVTLEYVLGEYPDTPEGNLMKNIRASVAEFERLKISERMVRGREQKVKAGHVLIHGIAPFGYREVKGEGKATLEVIESEAQVVRMIYQWYTAGDGDGEPLSMFGIQTKLNQLQVPTYVDQRQTIRTKRKPYGEWGRSQIGRILSSETYAGVWHYGKSKAKHGKRVAALPEEQLGVEVPAIVDRDIWELAQARRAEGKDKSKRNLKHQYLLRRRITCGLCGAKAVGFPARARSGKQYFYYQCPAAYNPAQGNFAHRCEAPSFRLAAVESVAWDWVKAVLTDPVEQEKGMRALAQDQAQELAPFRDRLTFVEEALRENQRQMERLLDAYLTGSFTKSVLDERSARLKGVREALEHERSDLTTRLNVQHVTEDDIRDLKAFGLMVRDQLEEFGDDFDFRELVITQLDVKATLAVEDGQKVVYVTCLGRRRGEALPIASQRPRALGRQTRLPGR
jgi:site-specific DNA recombinase